jgi:hypothetical protein
MTVANRLVTIARRAEGLEELSGEWPHLPIAIVA